ncbi:UDP-N-acetylmuramoyl-L-alanyl-D-glutamate--2,6-diaminopimelate ligase [Acidothermaceae bacterium B102]|nr:UDP-N-acetylmuramoyl-L-alanyl-D-glutamate--2,6-diaminopimelate ligase [Acidothermaceae bacterium B102]
MPPVSAPVSAPVPVPGPPRPVAGGSRRLGELVSALPTLVPSSCPRLRGADGDPTLAGISQDSHGVRAGDLYLARQGEHAHGATYAQDAVRAGAVAVLTDDAGGDLAVDLPVPVLVVTDARAAAGPVAAWVYGDPSAGLRLIGVTGTNGKTTTSFFVDAALHAAGQVTGLIGTVETRIAGQVVPSIRTTPDATDLQALFAVMRDRGVTSAVMEVSSHALALGRVDGTAYDVAVFTNLSQDHLDFHPDLESYFEAKALLFGPDRSRHAVVNVDDPHGVVLAERLRAGGQPVVTYSVSGAPADWRALDVVAANDGSTFRMVGLDGVDVAAAVRLPGRFNVANAMAALVAVVVAGIDIDSAVRGIAALAGVPGRMERIEAGQPFAAIVDYAHTPDAVATLLATLREVTPGRLIVVLGAGGDRDRSKRPLMGAAAASGADVAVLTSDNPRSEDPLEILAAVEHGARDMAGGAELVVEPDRRRAITAAVAIARSGDTLVVAGRGHEAGQEQAGLVVPFDDRAVLAEALHAVWGDA